MIHNKNGFTLIELMIVICLIAIITGFAVPSLLRAIPGIALKSAANDLASDMRYARSLAVKNQETVRVSFNPAAGLYQIFSSTVNKTVNLGDSRGGIRFGAGVATNAANQDADPFDADFDFVSFLGNDVVFWRNGMCNKNGYVYLCNENNDVAYAAGLSSRAGVVTFRKTIGAASWITL